MTITDRIEINPKVMLGRPSFAGAASPSSWSCASWAKVMTGTWRLRAAGVENINSSTPCGTSSTAGCDNCSLSMSICSSWIFERCSGFHRLASPAGATLPWLLSCST